MVDIPLETVKPAFAVSPSSPLVSEEVFTTNSSPTTTNNSSNSTENQDGNPNAITTNNISNNIHNIHNNNNIHNIHIHNNVNILPECLNTSPSSKPSSLFELSYWTSLYSFISSTVSKATDRLQYRSSNDHAPVYIPQAISMLPSESNYNNLSNNIHNDLDNDINPMNNLISSQTTPRTSSRSKSKRQLQQQINSSLDNNSTHKLTRPRNNNKPSHHQSVPAAPSFSSLMKTKTLTLDLDETLIHSTSRGSRAAAQMIEVMVDKHACLYYVYKRPHVDYFLKKVSEWYKVVIFTASMPEYADPVIDWLDPNKNLITSRYFRQSCTNRNGAYVKDLTIIEPDLSKVCLVDNSPVSYSLHEENGIPIEGWISDPKDEALLDLLPFLDALRFTDDVRSVLSLGIF
ncbi:hypothetical protein G9A89_000670 [Geosiphon pyriformis]|nr:hypothetical protein G9A89_000670 [Geosiphon pyriformis]